MFKESMCFKCQPNIYQNVEQYCVQIIAIIMKTRYLTRQH